MKVTELEDLKAQINELVSNGESKAVTEILAKTLNITLDVLSYRSGIMWNDGQYRRIFKLRLKHNKESYVFEYGDSINNSTKPAVNPSLYDVLSCLTKYDVGSYKDFCDNFGYEDFEKSSKKTYNAVCKEYEAMTRLFTEYELELLSEIW